MIDSQCLINIIKEMKEKCGKHSILLHSLSQKAKLQVVYALKIAFIDIENREAVLDYYYQNKIYRDEQIPYALYFDLSKSSYAIVTRLTYLPNDEESLKNAISYYQRNHESYKKWVPVDKNPTLFNDIWSEYE